MPQFEGQSTTGNFQEAISQAILVAKESLNADFVEWQIEKIYGEDGGFITVNVLKVIISAHPLSNNP